MPFFLSYKYNIYYSEYRYFLLECPDALDGRNKNVIMTWQRTSNFYETYFFQYFKIRCIILDARRNSKLNANIYKFLEC